MMEGALYQRRLGVWEAPGVAGEGLGEGWAAEEASAALEAALAEGALGEVEEEVRTGLKWRYISAVRSIEHK